MNHILLVIFDLLGTFAFAVSGVLAAKQKRLDLFGITFIAFVTACGGGIFRDLSLGATPPAAFDDWRYMTVPVVAVAFTLVFRRYIERLSFPIFLFDAIGLGVFAVSGAHKALVWGASPQMAVFMGMLTSIGGGMIRDIMLNRTPDVLSKEIYGLAALVGATIMTLGSYTNMHNIVVAAIGASVAFLIRFLSFHRGWELPRFS